MLWTRCLFLLLRLCTWWSSVRCHPRADHEPEFVGAAGNVTVTEGGDALLTCVVDNLGFYRVAWIRVESQAILSIHTHVITRNYRITLLHRSHQQWNLHISNVEESDRGKYMCQINTVPMKKRITVLEVLVPPKFVDRGENAEVLAREGTNVTLSCKVKGRPRPKVTWEREDGRRLSDVKATKLQGEDLTIMKVSRLHMGMYLCTAAVSYGDRYSFPPPVTRGIMLQVLFPPMIWIPNQLAYASISDTVSLDCYTEAFPMSINYWTKSDSCMIIPDEKFSVTLSDNVYKVSMKLVISGVQKEDFGNYKCVARNSLGSTEGIIRLYETELSKSRKGENSEERNEVEDAEYKYKDKIEIGIRNSDLNYKFMQNPSLQEDVMPKGKLPEKHLSDYMISLISSCDRNLNCVWYLGAVLLAKFCLHWMSQ